MADFAAADLLTAAEARYGATKLKARVAPEGDDAAKSAELLRIAQAVVSAIRSAAIVNIGWPLPGAWPAGQGHDGINYSEAWPDELLQKALDIFDYWTYSSEAIPDTKIKIGQAAEKWLVSLQQGGISLGTGTQEDTVTPAPASARDRAGNSLIGDGAAKMERVVDTFQGLGWDRA